MSEPKINMAGLGALTKGDIDNFIVASTPGGIEAQEAAGQRDFVAREMLPLNILSPFTQIQFEETGIVFGKQIDDLFQEAQLPEGWRKEPTDHSMWSKLLDEKGRERARIFYKAAFYDRSAHMVLSTRYFYVVTPVGGYESDYDPTSPRVGRVYDGEEVVWESEPMTPTETKPSYVIRDHLGDLAKGWLEEHYPDWQNPLAYWN